MEEVIDLTGRVRDDHVDTEMARQDEVISLVDDADDQGPNKEDGEASRPQKRSRQGPGPSGGDTILVDITNGDSEQEAMPEDQQELEEEEELRITGAKVEVWNKDLPHLRHECGSHPFSKQPHVGNARACSKCYCFVCDKPALSCTTWGEGSTEGDHCNAYDVTLYRQKKQEHQRQQNLQQLQQQQKQKQQAPSSPAAPAPAPATTSAPAPAPDIREGSELPPPTPDMLELGEVRLRCRVVNGAAPLRQLDAKLKRYGLLQESDYSSRCYNTHGLHLHSLFKPNAESIHHLWGNERISYEKSPLELIPPDLPPMEVPKGRTVMVVLARWGPGQASRPRIHGMEVTEAATLEDVAAKARETLQGDWEEQLKGTDGLSFIPPVRRYHLPLNMDDCTLKLDDTVRPWTRYNAQQLFAGKEALVVNFPVVPQQCKAQLAAEGSKKVQVMVFHTEPSTYCKYERRSTRRGLPTVFVFDEGLSRGGPKASKLLTEALQAALAPAGPLPKLEGLHRTDICLPWDSIYYHSSGRNPDLSFDQRFPTFRSELEIEAVWESGEAFERLVEWLIPVKDPASAAPELLKASVERHEKILEREKLVTESKAGVYRLLHEIQDKSKCTAAAKCRCRATGWSIWKQLSIPSLRTRVHLEAPDDESREGEVVFRLWAWTTPCLQQASKKRLLHRQLVLKEASYTASMGLQIEEVGGYRRRDRSTVMTAPSWDVKNELPHTLKALTSGVEGLEVATAEVKSWSKRHRGYPGITTPAELLTALETGEIEPAVQPPGLTVTLRPYQLQTLGFMQRAETGEGGFRKNLWFKVPVQASSSSSESPPPPPWWYSPVFKHACLSEPPPCPWGGFLGETMGLGKTVEVLALILADRPHLPAVPERAATLYPPGHPGRAKAAEEAATAAPLPPSAPTAPAAPVAPDAPDAAAAAATPIAPVATAAAATATVAAAAAASTSSNSVDAAPTSAAASTAAASAPAAEKLPERCGPRVCSNATLVVCAVSLVGQWVEEAQAKAGGSLKIYPYHGPKRIRDEMELATKYDVVVTTYATLSSDWSIKKARGKSAPKAEPSAPAATAAEAAQTDEETRMGRSPLHRVHWYRLVLDESHSVKDPNVVQSKACIALEASRRWCCSGTPLSSDCGDLLGQFSVLRIPPFNVPSVYSKRYKPMMGMTRMTAHKDRRLAKDGGPELLYTLGRAMVRHTKNQTTGGETVLQLPPLEESNVEVHLSAAEKSQYLSAHAEADATFRSIISGPNGTGNASKHLLQIMSLLLPLRRIASGGILSNRDVSVPELPAAKKAAEEAAESGPRAVPGLSVPNETQCAVCLDILERPVRTPCKHWFCHECILGCLETSSACPLCRSDVERSTLQKAAEEVKPKLEPEKITPDASAADPVPCESKLQALVAELRAMRARDGSAKALVFSQFMGTIEWLKARLPGEGFGFRYIDGSMPMKKRSKAIAEFQGDPPTTVFLLSMRAGAVGINLTAASHVFLLEPALNPALEEQAIGRAWRMGQTREVVVKRLFVKGSVEENIIKLKERRGRGGAGEASTSSGPGEEGSNGAGPSSSPADGPHLGASEDDGRLAASLGKRKVHEASYVAGSLHTDKQILKLEELNLLFAAPSFEADEPQPPQPMETGTAGASGGEEAADPLAVQPPGPMETGTAGGSGA